MNYEEEFKRQLRNNLNKTLEEFNTEKYDSLRELYKINFSKIENLINSEGVKISIESISYLDKNLSKYVLDNFMLLQEINRGIKEKHITKNSLK